ncbi:hypothetical protein ACFFRR_007557 [Megaselia abdita]
MRRMLVVLFYVAISFISNAVGVEKKFHNLDLLGIPVGSNHFRSCNTDEVCIKITECRETVESWERERTCDFKGGQSYVCCKVSPPKENKSRKKCLSLYKQRETIQDESLITPISRSDVSAVGGENAAFNEFPYMAALGWGSGQRKEDFLCGGVLIDPFYVLTAAHCTSIDGEPPNIIRIGGRNLLERNTIDINPDKIIIHPDYDPNVAYHDIALIKLKSRVRFLPACLWTHSTPTTQKLVALGYGHTTFAGENSNILQKVNITLFDNAECQKVYSGQQSTPNGITRNQICAGDFIGMRDTCQGDSGGPLLAMVKIGNLEIPQVIGITSLGSVCAGGVPSIYTRVSDYVDWIESSMI